MSIINDALKKAQKKLSEQGKKANVKQATKEDKPKVVSPTVAKTKKEMKKEKAWYNTVAFLVAIFFLVTGILLGTIFFMMQRSNAKSEGSDAVRQYRPKKIKRILRPGEIELNGISYIENRRVALINNEIYEEGDTVENHTILSVESSIVLLKDKNGEIITLKVR